MPGNLAMKTGKPNKQLVEKTSLEIKERAQRVSFTADNRKKVIEGLVCFCREHVRWRVLLGDAFAEPGALTPAIAESTVQRWIKSKEKGKKPENTMKLHSFRAVVWFLMRHGIWKEMPELDATKPDEIVYRALMSFLQTEEPEKDLKEKLVGCYQGYRWSVNDPQCLNRYKFEMKCDPETQVLLSTETTRYRKGRASGVFEGPVVVSPMNKELFYIVAREKRGEKIRGLQFTVLTPCFNDKDGTVTGMDATIVGLAGNNHFLRQVVFKRLEDPDQVLMDVEKPDLSDEDQRWVIERLDENMKQINLKPYRLSKRVMEAVEERSAAETQTPSAESDSYP
jgi:hypothetical protein